jgi:nickel/cobalt exporter
MPPIAEMIQQGSTNLWLFIPTAILLGAMHGLEPGHSKTMMASFIIAVKGSIAQAALLGLCAALSHSLIVWALAAVALQFGNALIAEQAEPYFMLLSSLLVIGVAVWMFIRTYRDNQAANAQQRAPHGGKIIDTGHGFVEMELYEDGVPPKFRLHAFGHGMKPQGADAFDHAAIETIRPDGVRQLFSLVSNGAYWESTDDIPEPHEFEAVLSVGHGDHVHRYEVKFSEEEHHHHGHAHGHGDSHHQSEGGEYQDAHERAHAEDIARRFVGRKVTTGQIAMFGLTGGLVPCPASVTILMICLHLKRFALGVAMVASFSFGLAISMVSVGVIAAWGAQQVGKRFGNLGGLARKMPYFSSGLMAVVGLIMGIQGAIAIMG